jgi:hypothetical protein
VEHPTFALQTKLATNQVIVHSHLQFVLTGLLANSTIKYANAEHHYARFNNHVTPNPIHVLMLLLIVKILIRLYS